MKRLAVALDELALRDARVLALHLGDAHRLVGQKVRDDALADAEVLARALVDGLLEVGVKGEHHAVVGEPLGHRGVPGAELRAVPRGRVLFLIC